MSKEKFHEKAQKAREKAKAVIEEKKQEGKLPLRVAVAGIDFQYDNTDHTNSTLPVYPLNTSWQAEHISYAAYSMADTREAVANNQLKVWVRFMKTRPGDYIQVRTINKMPKVTDVFSGKVFKMYPGKKAMGHVAPTRVYFGKTGQSIHRGKHSMVPLPLTDVKFHELGVGIYDVNWGWEYRVLSKTSTKEEEIWEERWRPICTTRHRIFVTLNTPQFPWMPYIMPNYNDDPPYPMPLWAEALTVACLWAEGSTTIKEAGKKIADRLYNSGKFTYNPNSSYNKEKHEKIPGKHGGSADGNDRVFLHLFYFSKVLERLKGGNGLGDKVNCLDCALIVATLTNTLGGNLQVGKFQNSNSVDYSDPEIFEKNCFEINAIKAIGHPDVPTTMKGLKLEDRHYFSYHSIAWQPAAEGATFNNPNNTIYDACVHFVKAGNEEELETASGRKAGDGSDPNSYRNKLAAPTDKGLIRCNAPQETVIKFQLR